MSALVLAYHGVDLVPFDDDRHRLFVSPQRLSRQVAALRRWGYRVVTFGELAASVTDGRSTGDRLAALTFDDGFADNRHQLLPVLAAHGVPATVFVVTGWLGRDHPDAPGHGVVTEADVRALHRAGVEVGSHGVSHRDLRTLPDDDLARDLAASREHLEALIDAPVRTFAYPYGDADHRVRAAVAVAGYAAACRTSGVGHWSDPFDLPRQAMGNGCSTTGLRLKRVDRYEQVLRWPGAARVRRFSRRAHNSWERRGAAPHPTAPPPGPG